MLPASSTPTMINVVMTADAINFSKLKDKIKIRNCQGTNALQLYRKEKNNNLFKVTKNPICLFLHAAFIFVYTHCSDTISSEKCCLGLSVLSLGVFVCLFFSCNETITDSGQRRRRTAINRLSKVTLKKRALLYISDFEVRPRSCYSICNHSSQRQLSRFLNTIIPRI